MKSQKNILQTALLPLFTLFSCGGLSSGSNVLDTEPKHNDIIQDFDKYTKAENYEKAKEHLSYFFENVGKTKSSSGKNDMFVLQEACIEISGANFSVTTNNFERVLIYYAKENSFIFSNNEGQFHYYLEQDKMMFNNIVWTDNEASKHEAPCPWRFVKISENAVIMQDEGGFDLLFQTDSEGNYSFYHTPQPNHDYISLNNGDLFIASEAQRLLIDSVDVSKAVEKFVLPNFELVGETYCRTSKDYCFEMIVEGPTTKDIKKFMETIEGTEELIIPDFSSPDKETSGKWRYTSLSGLLEIEYETLNGFLNGNDSLHIAFRNSFMALNY